MSFLPHLWILEDEPGARFVYENVLSLRYQITFFESTAQLGEALSKNDTTHWPQLLIADLRMPQQSFLQFLEARAPKGPIPFPFLVVTSVDDLDIARHCFQYGASDYLTKPFGKAQLIVKLERILENLGSKVARPVFSIELDFMTFQAQKGALRTDTLTQKEFQILSQFTAANRYSISRSDLIRKVWNGVHVGKKTLDVHLFNLRKKLITIEVELEFNPPNEFRLLGEGMNA